MSSIRLYVPGLCLETTALDPQESHHARHVLRVRPGDSVVVFDGAGQEGSAIIGEANRETVKIEVQSLFRRDFDVAFRLTLAVAMGKTHRQGYLIEKCTELGVAAFWPIIVDRSVTKPGDNATKRYRKRAIEAAKQSQRAWIPQVQPARGFGDMIVQRRSIESAYLADTLDGLSPFSEILTAMPPNPEFLVAIGPEGGWTDDERTRATDAGFVPVSLVPTTLRTETAAVAVCAAAATILSSR